MRRYHLVIAPFIIAAVICCTYLAYQPGLHGPFVFDDLTNILLIKTTYLTELSFASLKKVALAVDSGPLHRPIAILSFALNYYFSGLDVYYFKLVNLVIHIITGVALYMLSFRLLSWHTQKDTNSDYTDKKLQYTSLCIATIWLVHPLNLTSVLYVVQRMTSLASLFTVLGLLFYTIGRRQIIGGQLRGFLTITIGIFVFGTLGILTKEITALLPLYILLIETFFFRLAAAPDLKKRFKWFFLSLIVTPLLIGAIAVLLNPNALLALGDYQYRNFTLVQRLLTESRALWFYLYMIIVPKISLMGTYHDDFTISTSLLSPVTTLFSVAGLLFLLVIAIAGRNRTTILSFGIGWFLVGHLLESTIIPLELVHEHRNYLPQFGILFSLVYYLLHPAPNISRTLTLRYIGIFIFACMLGIATHARSQEWKDEWTLFNAEVKNHPMSPRSQTALAILYYDNKIYDKAYDHFEKAAFINRDNIETLLRLIHFEFSSTQKVQDVHMHELEYRIRHYSYTNTTTWIFGNLLKATTNNHAIHLKLLNLYEELINRRDITQKTDWRLASYQILGMGYENAGDPLKAAKYYLLAANIDSIAIYYIKAAQQYAKLHDINKTNNMIMTIAHKNLILSEDEKSLLVDLDKQIKSSRHNRK